MLDIEHLFENVYSAIERGEDVRALETHPATQYLLKNVYASYDEIVIIANYVYAACQSGMLCPEAICAKNHRKGENHEMQSTEKPDSLEADESHD